LVKAFEGRSLTAQARQEEEIQAQVQAVAQEKALGSQEQKRF
jgi:hypothetical protein